MQEWCMWKEQAKERITVKDYSDIMLTLSRNWLNSSDSLSAEVQHWTVDMNFDHDMAYIAVCRIEDGKFIPEETKTVFECNIDEFDDLHQYITVN